MPYAFFTATKGASPVEAVAELCAELRGSSLPADPDLVPVLETGSWPDAFRLLASALPEVPAIVVLDELPWLAEQDELFDGRCRPPGTGSYAAARCCCYCCWAATFT